MLNTEILTHTDGETTQDQRNCPGWSGKNRTIFFDNNCMVMIINFKNFIIAMVIKIIQRLINPHVCKMSLSKFQASDGPDVADSPAIVFSLKCHHNRSQNT